MQLYDLDFEHRCSSPPPSWGGDTFRNFATKVLAHGGGGKKTATKILAHGGGMKKIDLAPPIVGGGEKPVPPIMGGTEKCCVLAPLIMGDCPPPSWGGGQNVTRVTCNPGYMKNVTRVTRKIQKVQN